MRTIAFSRLAVVIIGIAGCVTEVEDVPADAIADVKVSQSDADAFDGCAPPNAWLYATAGCGDAANPTCGNPTQDACAITLCGCSGETIKGCQWAMEPWVAYGPCDAGAD
jgi:hypothetical protein